MITLLSRFFIKDHEKTDLPEVRRRYGVLSGIVGIFLNLILFAGKLLAGALVRSVSITADAFNNLSDAATSVMTLIGFRLAGKKADEDHPFGHGRFEYIAGLLVSISILLMGLELARTSVSRILHPARTVFSAVSMGILVFSIGIKLYMYFYNRVLAGRIDSVALRSTAADSLSDCVSTAVVLLCQILSHVCGIYLDGWCGLCVSLFILYTGVSTLQETASPLLGKAPDPELASHIAEAVLETEGILDMHDLLIHDYGPGHLIVSLHAEMPSDLTLIQAHEIIDRLEARLDREFGITSLIHIDPVDQHDHEAILLRDSVLKKLHALHPDAGLHDFRILRDGETPTVSFDASFPYDYPGSDEEIITELLSYLKKEYPKGAAVIRIDRQ